MSNKSVQAFSKPYQVWISRALLSVVNMMDFTFKRAEMQLPLYEINVFGDEINRKPKDKEKGPFKLYHKYSEDVHASI